MIELERISENNEKVDYNKLFSSGQIKLLEKVINQPYLIEDDRWIVVYKGNYISFYRTWTKTCIYEVNIEENLANEACVLMDEEKYISFGEESDTNIINELIDAFLSSIPKKNSHS